MTLQLLPGPVPVGGREGQSRALQAAKPQSREATPTSTASGQGPLLFHRGSTLSWGQPSPPASCLCLGQSREGSWGEE